MFCNQCGTKIKEGDAFCTACGAKNMVAVSQGTPAVSEKKPVVVISNSMENPREEVMQPTTTAQLEKKEKSVQKKSVLILVAVAVALCAVFFVFPMLTQSVNISEFYTATIEGYDGYATVEVENSADLAAALNEQYSGKNHLETLANSVSFTVSKIEQIENGDRIVISFNYDEELAKELGVRFTGNPLAVRANNLTELDPYNPFENFEIIFHGYDCFGEAKTAGSPAFSTLKYTAADNGALRNGQSTTVTVTMDPTQAIAAGVRMEPKEKSFAVSGLKELDENVIFQDIEVLFTGTAPNMRAEVQNISKEPAFQAIVYKATPEDGLSIGDSVTVSAVLPKREGEKHSQEIVSATPCIAKLTESYLTDYASLRMEDRALLEEAAERLIDERSARYPSEDALYMHDFWQPRKISDTELPGATESQTYSTNLDSVYVLSSKTEKENQIVLIYEVSFPFLNADRSWVEERSYFVLTFDGVTLYGDNSADLKLDSGKICRVADPEWYSLSDVYEEVVGKKSSEFNINETILRDSHEEEMAIERETFPEGFPWMGMISYSSERYLMEADVRGMKASNMEIARNEIYARHGCTFDDPALQEHMEQNIYRYEGIMPLAEFDDSALNDYERFNLQFLLDHEQKASINEPEPEGTEAFYGD